MALIDCPECSKKISNKANNCPYCGFPIEINKENQSANLSKNLSIGKKITSWLGDKRFEGIVRNSEHNVA